MEIKDRTIALLIDSDNISEKYFSIILDELSQYGRVTYRRLYGDFTTSKTNGWKKALLEYSVEQIQQVAFTTGKNATDSKMIIDAMDILYNGNVDCFCLATSDSDFTNLAMRFRNDNLVVIGAGEQKTPSSFRKACDIFIPIDELMKAEEDTQTVKTSKAEKPEKSKDATDKNIKSIIKTAKQIISESAEADGWMHFSAFMNEIRRKENDFNPKLYGFQNSRPIQFFKSLTEKRKAIFTLERKNNVDKIKINKED